MSSKKSAKTKKTTKKVAKKTAKKAVKKTAAKKTVPKKSTNKKTTKKAATTSTKKNGGMKLVNASKAKCFWVNHGPVLKNLLELEAALEAMSEEMFAYHVTKERNDFADWVEYVLKDFATAEALRKSKKPHTARRVVVRQLKLYKLPE